MPSPSYSTYTTTDSNNLTRSFDIIDISGCGHGPFIEAANNSYTGAIPVLADGVALTARGRALQVSCTTAGNLSITFVDGSSLVIPVDTGTTILPYVVSKINATGTTATATYAVLR